MDKVREGGAEEVEGPSGVGAARKWPGFYTKRDGRPQERVLI